MLKQNPDGTYEFYIRAADRGKINFLVNNIAGLLGYNATEIFYEITDQAWNNLMTTIINNINDPNNGGQATQNQSNIMRPNWSEVKSKLKLPEPLESIPCQN